MTLSPTQSRRIEVVARRFYREWMKDDYDEFPWDDEHEPSNETVAEACRYATMAVEALAEDYRADDEHFERAVDEAARRKLQELVRALDA